jgi:acid phosphatase
MLASLGCFNMTAWPPYTSHIAYELFHKKDAQKKTQSTSWDSKFWTIITGTWPSHGSFTYIGKTPTNELRGSQKAEMDGYYVRVRYNDQVMTVPGCKVAGNHLEGDESFCTLVSSGLVKVEHD